MTETPIDPADGAARDVVAYYHQPVKGPLLRGAVLPLAERCAAEGLTVHVERHWLHGPHLRLRLRGPAAQVADAAARGAAQLRDWVRDHPSVSDQDAEQLLAGAAEAGRAELIAPPYGPIVPDNTVRVERVDLAELRSLIGADGVLLRDELLGMGRPALHAAAGFLGRCGDGAAARVQLAVAALAAHAAAHPGGLVGGHYSYVSHLEDFLVHDDPDGRLRRAFDDRWEATGEAVTALVGRIGAGGATGWEQAWADWSAAAWQLTERRRAAGADLGGHPYEYRVRAAATGDAGAAERWNQDVRTRYSEFHRLLRRSDPQGAMWSRPEYLVYRTCTNALYRLFAICDLRPLERYLAAHLVVRAVPAVTGHDWRSQVGAVIEAVERAS
ncbi:lantibiotic dehydratase C-terminal domain-containing protein [Kitasatospora sp. NPDC094015]|uniref:lantibiotic dehydratase C-terminal domain-containing protein n=1 Tax=Kitasatospora sp. NPDC094015 TaxID=3155205 RepID=UPI00331B16D6